MGSYVGAAEGRNFMNSTRTLKSTQLYYTCECREKVCGKPFGIQLSLSLTLAGGRFPMEKVRQEKYLVVA